MNVQIKENIPLKKRKTYWYSAFSGESFPLFLETKAGYLVTRPGFSEKWNIKKNHACLIDDHEYT